MPQEMWCFYVPEKRFLKIGPNLNHNTPKRTPNIKKVGSYKLPTWDFMVAGAGFEPTTFGL